MQISQVSGRDVGQFERCLFGGRQRIRVDPVHIRQGLAQAVLKILPQTGGGQNDFCFRIRDDALQAGQGMFEPHPVRRRDRNRDDAGIQTPEECGKNLEPGRIQQQCPRALRSPFPQLVGNRESVLPKRRVISRVRDIPAILQEVIFAC